MSADVLEFASEAEWTAHLAALGLTELRVTPNPVRVASEGALWGAIVTEDRLANSVILSDDAGQFHVGLHALCWVHGPSASSTSSFPPTTDSATPSRSPGG